MSYGRSLRPREPGPAGVGSGQSALPDVLREALRCRSLKPYFQGYDEAEGHQEVPIAGSHQHEDHAPSLGP